MAVSARRGGGTSGYAVALVVFVILFVIALIAAILFYTQVNSARVQAAQMRSDRDKLLKPTERSQPDIQTVVDAATGPESVVFRLINENQQLKSLLAGDPREPVGSITARVENPPLLTELSRLKAELTAAQTRITKAEAERAAALKRLATVEEEKKANDDKLAQAERELRGKVDALSQAQKTYETTVAGERQRLESRINELQTAYRKDTGDLSGQLEQITAENQVLRNRLDALLGTGRKGIEGPDPATLPDGRIMSVSPDSRLVYLNIGRSQHVSLGLSFVVFDRATRLERDQTTGELLGGKALIEVISLAENTSSARVVHLNRGATLSEGDLIANVVYDPNLTYKFVVFGEFDVDSTGQPSPQDRKRIETMITQWGGQLVDAVAYDVDFLVLGIQPAMPEPLPRGVRDPVLIEEHARQQRIWEAYQHLITEANRYQIPVLNQNRFLQLVGYFQR